VIEGVPFKDGIRVVSLPDSSISKDAA
jgi:hypothetical protein